MMKKYLLIALAAAPLCLSAAVKTAVVNSDGSLAYPTASTFAAKNNLVSQEVLFVRVDMFKYSWTSSGITRSEYWKEVELKVLDKNGALIYFICTMWWDRAWHANHPELIDNGARIAYYPFGNGITGVCAHKKVWLTITGTDDYSDGTNIAAQVAAVEIYPNLSGTVGGKSVREIFLNPENTILVSRKDDSQYEKDGGGTRIWRPAVIQYYRAMPPQN